MDGIRVRGQRGKGTQKTQKRNETHAKVDKQKRGNIGREILILLYMRL